MSVPNERGAKAWREVSARYDRGVKHLKDFYAAFDAFRDDHPHEVGIKTDPQTGDVTYYLTHVPEIPLDLPLMAGDALHNLRSTLDHLAYKLVVAAGNAPGEKTAFPIYESQAKYEEYSPRRLLGMHPLAIRKIDALCPYKGGGGGSPFRPGSPYLGGSDLLWILHKLDIIDKHRLILTLATGQFVEGLPESKQTGFVAAWESKYKSGAPPGLSRGIIVKARTERLLKTGDELKTVPAAEADDPIPFRFDITVSEPEASEGMSCYLLFEMIKSEVYRIISDFAPLL